MISTLAFTIALGVIELHVPTSEITISLTNKETHSCLIEYVNNSSENVQVWGTTNFWLNHRIDVKTKSGDAVLLTDKGVQAIKDFTNEYRDGNYAAVLRPGKSFRNKTPRLPEFFVLVPGEYVLRVTYSDQNFGKPLDLVSKWVPLKVRE